MLALNLTNLLIFSKLFDNGNQESTYKNSNQYLPNCISQLVLNLFDYGTALTTYNMGADNNDEIIQAINNLSHVLLTTKNRRSGVLDIFNEGYLINAGNVAILGDEIEYIVRDKYWNPAAMFIVFVENLKSEDYRILFNNLLKLKIFKTVVLTGHGTLITYDPFENYCCGQTYRSVISLGNCRSIKLKKFFNLTKASLANCNLRVSSPYFPPHTINTALVTDKDIKGSDQCILELLAEIGQFYLEYTYEDISEEFTKVYPNMTVTGPLQDLQTNRFDIAIGSNILIESRALVFDYISEHVAFKDAFRIFVPVAGITPRWKIMYLEFNNQVWIILIVTFVCYLSMTIILIWIEKRNWNQTCSVILFFWQTIISNGNFRLRSGPGIKIILVTWIWYQWLINNYYNTTLMSLTTMPGREYQIKQFSDAKKHNFKSCTSTVMKDVLEASSLDILEEDSEETPSNCKKIVESLETVYKSKDMYTLSLMSIFFCNRHRFVSRNGVGGLYILSSPMQKVLSAFYFYKGFPIKNEMRLWAIRLVENGCVDRCLSRIFHYYSTKYQDNVEKVDADTRSSNNTGDEMLSVLDLKIHFCILMAGSALATVVFFLELLFHYCVDENL